MARSASAARLVLVLRFQLNLAAKAHAPNVPGPRAISRPLRRSAGAAAVFRAASVSAAVRRFVVAGRAVAALTRSGALQSRSVSYCILHVSIQAARDPHSALGRRRQRSAMDRPSAARQCAARRPSDRRRPIGGHHLIAQRRISGTGATIVGSCAQKTRASLKPLPES